MGSGLALIPLRAFHEVAVQLLAQVAFKRIHLQAHSRCWENSVPSIAACAPSWQVRAPPRTYEHGKTEPARELWRGKPRLPKPHRLVFCHKLLATQTSPMGRDLTKAWILEAGSLPKASYCMRLLSNTWSVSLSWMAICTWNSDVSY